VLRQLRVETAAMKGAHMQISPEQGQLMGVLVELLGVRRAIEVGVFTGYSSLAVALVCPRPPSDSLPRCLLGGGSAMYPSRLGTARPHMLVLRTWMHRRSYTQGALAL
jgi:hypothetical protein